MDTCALVYIMLKPESQFSVGWADGYHVDGGWGGMQIQVKSVEDCMKLLILGDRNRCFAFTKLVSSVVGKLSPKKWEKKRKKGSRMSTTTHTMKITLWWFFHGLQKKPTTMSDSIVVGCWIQNAHSSRSHVIVILTVEKKAKYQTLEQKAELAERLRMSSCFLESERLEKLEAPWSFASILSLPQAGDAKRGYNNGGC